MAGDLPGHVDDLLDGEAHSVAQVEHVVVPALQQIIQSQDMGLGQIGDVDIVPDAGAVLGGVVVAENGDLLPLAVGHLEDQGDQMGLRGVRLANGSGGMSAAGVEVPQGHIPQAMGPAGPGHHLLHGQLGLAVAVGGDGLVRLQDGDPLRLAVGGGGGGEHDLVHPVGHHGLQQTDGAAQVVVIVLQRIAHGLAHLGGGGKMDDALDLLLLKQLVQCLPVPDVQLIEARLGVHGGPEAGEQVVRHHHVPAGIDEFVHGVRADIAGSTQH